jgi:hypothetical protein
MPDSINPASTLHLGMAMSETERDEKVGVREKS